VCAKFEQLFGYDWIFKVIFSWAYLGEARTLNARYNDYYTCDAAQYVKVNIFQANYVLQSFQNVIKRIILTIIFYFIN